MDTERLPQLPPSGESWVKSFGESYQDTANPIVFNEHCPHFFEQLTGREIQCKNCFWGLYIDGRDEVRDGHLYRDGEKVI